MDRSLLAVTIIVALIAIFSVPVIRRSNHRDKVYGGRLAQTFHLIAIAAYIGVAPSFLCGSILVGPSNFGLPLGLSLLAVTLFSLTAYAIIERPARASRSKEDRGWTEEDARRSGL